jgi:hypothetical protein
LPEPFSEISEKPYPLSTLKFSENKKSKASYEPYDPESAS